MCKLRLLIDIYATHIDWRRFIQWGTIWFYMHICLSDIYVWVSASAYWRCVPTLMSSREVEHLCCFFLLNLLFCVHMFFCFNSIYSDVLFYIYLFFSRHCLVYSRCIHCPLPAWFLYSPAARLISRENGPANTLGSKYKINRHWLKFDRTVSASCWIDSKLRQIQADEYFVSIYTQINIQIYMQICIHILGTNIRN